MSKHRLYVVHCMGNDAVGLVGRITASIAEAQGNIVDLRQDVLHGLFTLYMVVDLSKSAIDFAKFQSVLDEIAEDTNLRITVDQYSPIGRSPDVRSPGRASR